MSLPDPAEANMKKIAAPAALLLSVLLTACGGHGDPPPPVYSGNGPSSTPVPDCTGYSECALFENHAYSLYVPTGAADDAPWLILLHGSQIARDDTENNWRGKAFADRYGYRLAIPEGINDVWNYTTDPALIVRFIAKLRAEHGTPRGVFLVGWSNGSQLSQRLACDAADSLTGVVSYAGELHSSHPCHPARPIGVELMHNRGDSVVPIAGGSFGAMPITANYALWKGLNGCAVADTVIDGIKLEPPSLASTTRAQACGAPVEMTINNGGDHRAGWDHAVLHPMLADFFARSLAAVTP